MFWKKSTGKKKNNKQPDNTMYTGDPGHITVVIRSDMGNIRTNNEDMGLFYCNPDKTIMHEKGCLLIVADGMGGHQAGEVASRMAVDIISNEYFKQNGNTTIEKALAKAFEVANARIYATANASREHQGMGTTCTALVVADQTIYYAHVGDSRAYHLKEQGISRITSDHTYVQELIDMGELTPEEAGMHAKRNILTNAMGTKKDLRVDTGRSAAVFVNKDRLLLCSDGLYEYINDQELAAILEKRSLKEAADYMIEEAKKRGGHDNITVVLAEKKETEGATVSRETKDFDLPVTREIDLP